MNQWFCLRRVYENTMDYHEAYALATRLAVLQDGQVVQEGTPAEVFGRPLNAFVAGLTGIKNY